MSQEHFERAKEILTEQAVSELAHIGKFPISADLTTFWEMLCIAVGLYFEEKESADVNQIARETKALWRGALAFRKASAATQNYVKLRQARLGRPDPQSLDDIRGLVAYGGSIAPDRKRQRANRKDIFQPLLFAPTPNRHLQRRSPDSILIIRTRIAYFHATGLEAPKTATNRYSRISNEKLIGPFPRMLNKIFELSGHPEVNVANVMNRANDLEKMAHKNSE